MAQSIFESIRHINEYDQEYWSARDLYRIFEYSEYRHFLPAIEKAKIACKNSGQDSQDHFEELLDMVSIGSDAKREVSDYHLSRYACYLIIQNADPSKRVVAEGQTYFAIQTHRQEISDHLLADRRRVDLRSDLTEHNKKLASTAKGAWVWNYGEFTDYGYMWLYGGMKSRDIHARKKLKPIEKILDHMGSEELAANLFRATQAEAKIKREWIKGQTQASKAHYDVGKKIRSTIAEIGGTMPENLEIPENISKVKSRILKEERKYLL
jgi:DNA-damage-inducible protein D